MSPTPIRIGISTCPNDTFAFHGLLSGAVRDPGLELQFELLDVEELNRGLAEGRYDVAKGSFHAGLLLAEQLLTLPVGAALGFGVGPVVLSRPGGASAASPKVACPGRWTTATLLWQLFHPDEGALEQRPFHEIIPALEAGESDLGVCIHEARFTYEAHGLELIEDLGATWERETGAPLPLGGIFARRSLGDEQTARVTALIQASLAYGRANPDEALTSMRRYAQEFEDDVLREHVTLYVNEFTTALGEVGEGALSVLGERARHAGLLKEESAPLEIFGG